ncbi:reverse transcriptase domain-containing protein [Tanacetum coccineum]
MMAIFHDMIEMTMEVFMDDSSVFRGEGIVLGHKIFESGIEVDHAKVDVIANLPHPTIVKARPMTHLLEKETPFVFSKDCIDAFETLKKKLTEAPILVVSDWNLPFEIMCDASDFAIEAKALPADDLLMLCNGDVDSLKVIKKSLDEFNSASGLLPNHNKSTIFFGSILKNKKQELLEIMSFKSGKLPMKYLGVPLLTKRLGVNDRRCLVENVERRINWLADDAKVADLIHNGNWIWPDERMEDFPELQQIPIPVMDNNVKDKVC